MSILIKGMEMPEHCGYCRFRYDGICHALQKTQYSIEECPLIPIQPHGRLIDADALFIPYDICDGEEAMEFIKAASTIISAEEE